MRYSGLSVLKEGLFGNKGWKPAWRDPEPKAEYDAIIVVVGGHALTPLAVAGGSVPIPPAAAVTNIEALGALIYTHYIYLFQAAGMVLLVAMIGAIVLTHRTRKGVRKQRIADQIARRAEETIELVNVEPRKGI